MENNTSKEIWKLTFTLIIDGSDSAGEPVHRKKIVKIKLFATTEEEASNEANQNIEKIRKMRHKDLKKNYFYLIQNDDEIAFTRWKIVHEKTLAVEIPKLL